MRDVFLHHLVEVAQTDERIMLLTGDLGFKVLDEFIAQFPDRFFNIGIAEQNMTGIAAGLALEGYVPLTYSLGSFPTVRAMEQVRIDVAYHQLPVKIVTVGGGMSYGALGMSHHATEDIAMVRALPHMMVLAPGDDWEVGQLTPHMLAHDGPVYLRLDKTTAGNTQRDGEEFTFGKIRTVREGDDVTIMTTGGVLVEALAAADQLAQEGISARILSVHCVKPLDAATIIQAAQETKGIITAEEHVLDGGLGSAVAEVLMDAGVMPKQFIRLGLNNEFATKVGSQAWLRNIYKIDAVAMVAAAKNMQ